MRAIQPDEYCISVLCVCVCVRVVNVCGDRVHKQINTNYLIKRNVEVIYAVYRLDFVHILPAVETYVFPFPEIDQSLWIYSVAQAPRACCAAAPSR